MTYDMIAHLTRQAVFSRATFGPGPRTQGVIDHIAKELNEICVAEDELGRSTEWADVAILALDGLLRSTWALFPNHNSTQVAEIAVNMIAAKQGKNERRNWPDWRGASPDKAIEHIRGKED